MKDMSKKEKIMVIVLILLILLFTFVVLFVIANKDNNDDNVLEVPNYYDDVNNYILLEEIDTAEYYNLYKSVNLKKVNFKNVSELLYSEFNEKQEEYINTINNNIKNNEEFIDNYNKENNIDDYKINSNIDSIILYEINDGVISLLYLIEDNVDYVGLNNYIYSIFIDVKNNAILSDEIILEKYGKTKKEVSGKIFDNFILSVDDENVDEIMDKKEEYISIISNNFSTYVYLYVNDNELYVKYNKSDFNKLLFDKKIDNVKYSTLKI